MRLPRVRLVYLSWLLMRFEIISRFRMNLDKSKTLLMVRLENFEVLALELQCKAGAISSYYLGLPLGALYKFATI